MLGGAGRGQNTVAGQIIVAVSTTTPALRKGPMDQLEAIRAFVAIADHGGFAAAARGMRLSTSTVTRALSALETRLGVVLVRRSTRAASLTEAGRDYLAACRRIIADLDEADQIAAGEALSPRGLLTITAPVQFGRVHVAPLVFEFLRSHPDVRASLRLVDRTANLVEEGIDVAVRIGDLPDSSLIALHVGEVRRVVCASPAYLAARGTPARPADLLDHELIEMTGMAAFGNVWSFVEQGQETSMRVTPRLSVNQTDVALAAALAGHGITRLLSYQLVEYLQDGRLRALLTDSEPPPLPASILRPAGRSPSAKVRAFVEFAAARLRARRL
jgi:DNA-binding transcriptional LysR family regulator